jgi:hypothetical protein
MMYAMNRTHVDLTDDQHAQLHEVARRKGRSLNDLIQEAIGLFLEELAPEPDSVDEETEAGKRSPEGGKAERDDRSA